MEVKFKKKDLEKLILNENQSIISIPKHKLRLKEDANSTAYVEPSSDNTSSLATDLSQTKSSNPTDNTLVVNNNSYDGDSSNNTVSLDVDANSTSDAASKIQMLNKNPNVKNLMSRTNVNTKVHLKERLENLRENSVMFTKDEIRKILSK